MRIAAYAPFAVVVLALAACGSGGSKSGVAGASTAMVKGQKVVAVETEYKIQLSTTNLQPGPATFVAENQGHVAHSLEIDGPGVSDKRIAGTIQPGQSMQLQVTLQKGSYEVYCPVDGHKGLGMDTHVTVGGMSSSGGGTTTSSGGGGGGC